MSEIHKDMEKDHSDHNESASYNTSVSKEDFTENEKLIEKKKLDQGKEGWKCPDPNCRKFNPKEAEACGQCKLSVKMAKDYDKRRGEARGGRGGRGGKGSSGRSRENAPRRIPNDVDVTNPVVVQFVSYSHLLDDRHDRHERIVKMSRDITIESKRIIFALHRIKTDKDKPCVLGEAEMRLGTVRKNLWRSLAFELKGQDGWQYLRGYTAGLQEYIEALSLYHYLCYDKIIEWKTVQEELTFQVRRGKKNWEKRKKFEENVMREGVDEEGANKIEKEENVIQEASGSDSLTEKQPQEGTDHEASEINEDKKSKPVVSNADEKKDLTQNKEENNTKAEGKEADAMILEKNDKEENKNEEETPIKESAARKVDEQTETKEEVEDEFDKLLVTVPHTDYILGLADLTGELMRNAINSVAAGNTEACFSLLNLLQQIDEGFSKLDKALIPRYVERKLGEFKRSLKKVEDACYAINVRGSELPKDHLGDVFANKTDDGFHSHARDPIEEMYYEE